MVTFSVGKRAVIVAGMCVISCASLVPDKSGRHFLSSSVALSLRGGGGERVHGCFVGVGRHVAARPPAPIARPSAAAAAIGTFSNDKRGEMDRKTAKKREREQRTNHRESPSKRERERESILLPPFHMSGIN